MYAQLTRSSGSFLRLLLSVISLLLPLLLVGCGTNTQNSTVTTSNPTLTPTTAIQTATVGNTPKPGKTPPPPTPGPVPFTVTGVSFSAWPGDHTGVCRTNTFFTASVLIHVSAHNAGGTVTYTWLRSDTSTIHPSTVTFAAGTTSRIVTTIWPLSASQGNGSAHSVALKTLSPAVFTTPRIVYHYTCQRQVQSSSATVSPTSGCNSVTRTFTFHATVNVSPGANSVTLTYAWKRSNGTSGATTTSIVPQSATTVTLSDSWTLTAPIAQGTYWEELFVTAPESVSSNQATFDITSC